MTTDFKSFGFLTQLEENLVEMNFTTPTPIQAQALGPLLEGKDLMGIAQTGTGKTAAFALPIAQKLGKTKMKMRPGKFRSLIIAPTRELASQIHRDIRSYSQGTGLKVAIIFGGIKSHNQIKALKAGPDIVVATPGRLEDLYNQGHVKFDQVTSLVLDEADRMLDMGFIGIIRNIISLLPEKRQNIFFSATMPKAVLTLANEFLVDPVKVEVTPESSVVERIQQQVVTLAPALKFSLLLEIINQKETSKVLIFSRTKVEADALTDDLIDANVDCEVIHGDIDQKVRAEIMKEFRNGELTILVATDVAARGLDIDQVSHVINYEVPMEAEAYVHRIGRTGRAGKEGVALTFCTSKESREIQNIQDLIQVPLPAADLHKVDWPALGFQSLDISNLQRAPKKESDRPKAKPRPHQQANIDIINHHKKYGNK